MNKRICLNQSVLSFMESKLNPESFVLEFGAGWSSRWFADRCGRLLSIETSKKWAELVTWDLMGAECYWRLEHTSDPEDVLSMVVNMDLVLIDCVNKLRERCVRLSWPLLRQGGWLIFDDAQRPGHAAPIKYLNSFGEPVLLGWDEEYDIPEAKERIALAWQKSF